MKSLFGLKAEDSGEFEYPEVGPDDPRYNDIAKRPPSQETFEEWRFEDLKCEKLREVEYAGKTVTVHPHDSFVCMCPKHGETYLLEVRSPEGWPQPSGKGLEHRWAISMACGCVWRSGGLIGGGNKMAGFFLQEEVQRATRVPVRMAVRVNTAPAAVALKVAVRTVQKVAVRVAAKKKPFMG